MCQIVPVSASQAHLGERDEAPPSPHCFQFQIYHSHAQPTTPAHPGLEKDHPNGMENSHYVYVWGKKVVQTTAHHK